MKADKIQMGQKIKHLGLEWVVTANLKNKILLVYKDKIKWVKPNMLKEKK